MARQAISTTEAPAAIGPYSQAIRAGEFIFVSGQVPVDPATGELIQGSIDDETVRVLENMKAVLHAAGLTLSDVVKTTIFLTDLSNFTKVNAVYASYFGEEPPARSTIQVGALPRGAHIEIEAIAMF